MRGGVCGERGFLGYMVFGGLLGLGYGHGLSVVTFIFLGDSWFFCWFLSILVDRVVGGWSCGGLGSNEWNIFGDRLFCVCVCKLASNSPWNQPVSASLPTVRPKEGKTVVPLR